MTDHATAPYETERLLAEYLLFHYGAAHEQFPHPNGPRDALFFPVRCVSACLDRAVLPENARALDVGCAVGRSTFELARHCRAVIGIDASARFIAAARALRDHGALAYHYVEEGPRRTRAMARVPDGIDRGRVHFETGDALRLREDLGIFDVVLAANLLCRLREPARFLARLPSLLRPGGQLILTTPCSWTEEFTPQSEWLCGPAHSTLDGIRNRLEPAFALRHVCDLPFLIREHARKFQWTVAQASVWQRR